MLAKRVTGRGNSQCDPQKRKVPHIFKKQFAFRINDYEIFVLFYSHVEKPLGIQWMETLTKVRAGLDLGKQECHVFKNIRQIHTGARR